MYYAEFLNTQENRREAKHIGKGLAHSRCLIITGMTVIITEVAEIDQGAKQPQK